MSRKFLKIIVRQFDFHNQMRGQLSVYSLRIWSCNEKSNIFAKMTKYFAQNKLCEVVYSIYSQSIIKVEKKEMFKVQIIVVVYP